MTCEKNNIRRMGARKIFILLIFFILTSVNLLAQSYLIPVDATNNKYPITFTDAAQQTLILEFDRAVTAPGTSAGWTITVGGVPVAMAGNPVMAGNFLRIVLPASISFANRNSVIVSYNAAVGTMSLTGGLEPTITNVQAINNYIGVQADFSNGLYGENPPVDICAAVQNVDITSNIVVSTRFRNSIHFRTPRMYTLWMFPAVNPKTDPNYVETGGVGSGIYSATQSYAAYPDNTTNCTWVISVYPFVLGAPPQPILNVTNNQVFITIPNYKKDNGTPVPGTGDLGLDPPVDDPRTLFCVGEDINAFIFRDATVFDCQLGVEPNLPNTRPRYAQFVYGTHTAPGIPNVFINVFGTMVRVTDNNGVAIQGTWFVNPDGTPNGAGYTTPSGYFEGPVTQYVWDATTKALITPMISTYPIFHSGDYVNDMENDIFDVTLRNWGPCNPYDAFDPMNHLNAVTEFSRLRLVGAPPLPTAPDVTVCFGNSNTLSAVRNGLNPGLLHWYNNSDLLPVHEVGTGNTYNPGVLAAGAYSYWVREIGTTGLLCEGPSELVLLTINPLPNKPTITYTGNLEFCFDGTTSVILRANVVTPPAVTSYQWYRNGIAVGGATANTLTLNQGSQTGSYTVTSIGANPTNCPSPVSDPVSVIIHSLTNLTNPVPAAVCQNGSVIFSANTTDLVQNWQWEVSTNGGVSFSTVGNGPPYSGFNSNTLTINPADISLDNYYYRVEIKTPPGQGGCPFKSGSAMLTVNPNAAITLTSGAGTNIQTRCINTPISNITWSVTGGGTGATVAGLPSGVTGSYSAGIYTISGTPNVSGTFNYTVTTTGTCTQTTATGRITVTPNNTITRTSTAATENQTVCINTAITNIRYTTTGATGATFTGLPAGVTGTWAANVININGTPTASGTFNFTITLTGGCGTITRNAVITVTPANTITLSSAAGTDNQTVCINTLLTTIRYSTTRATGATFSGLPAGVTGSWAANVITINGTPTASGTFTYTITTSGGCGPVTQTGTITVSPINTITLTSAAGTDAQNVCINNPLTSITYSTTGATGATFAGLPAGISGSWAGNAIIISGTPTASGNYNFTITLTGGCGIVTKTGTIRVNPNNTITLTSGAATENQTVCINTAIVNIRYTTTGASGATFSGLPAGVNGSWAASVINITGTPIASGSFNYTITLTGGCGLITRGGSITVNPAATVNAGPDQAICAMGTASLNGAVGGSAVSGSWSGGTGSYAPNNLALNAVYTPSAGERASNTVTLTLTTNDPAGPCPAVTDQVTISIGAPLTAATLTGSGDACVGATSTITSVLTGGAPPYTINYTLNGVAQTALFPYISGSPFNLGVLPVGTYNYRITSVTDPCGNSVPPAGLPAVYTIHILPIPNISGSVPASQTICSNGTASLTLNSTVNNTNFSWSVSSSPAAGYSWTAGKDPVAGSVTDADGNGTETISRQLQHNYSSPITVTYTITPTGPGATACPGTPITRTVIVNPVPAIANMTSTVCGGTAFSATPANGTNGVVPAGTTYSWAAPVVTGSLTGGTAGAGATSISGNLSNPTNIAQTATYTVTPLSGSCTGATFTVTVTVNPTPAITNMAGSACTGTAFSFSPVNGANGIVPGGTTYTWPVPVVTGTMTGAAAGTNAANIGGTLNNPTNLPQTATYTVTPTSGTCAGATFTVTVTVNPKATIANKTAIICSGTAFSITPTNGGAEIVPGGTLYTWSAPVIAPAGSITGGSAQGTGQASISQTLTNTTNAVATATYTVTPTSGTCAGATFTVTVTVNPAATIANKTAIICSGTAFSVTPVNGGAEKVPGGTTYTWVAPVIAPAGAITGGSAQGTGQASISQTLTNTTNAVATATYTVTPTSGTCAGATFTVTVTVNPNATIANKVATICSGTAFSITPVNGGAEIVPGGTLYTWSAPVIAPAGSVTGGSAQGTGQASISQTLTNTTNAVATATYTVTPTSGTCAGATFTVTVTVNPKATIANTTAIICSGTAFSITPANGGAEIVPGGTLYTWSAPVIAPAGSITGGSAQGTGQASISQTLTNTTNAVATATYTVTPTSGTCPGATFTVTVTVSPKATIANKTATICSGTAFSVTPTNGGAEVIPVGTSYTWVAPVVAPAGAITGGSAQGTGQASISQTLTNTTDAVATATYTVTPTSGTCAGATFTITVTVNPNATIANKTATICSGTAFSVTPVNGGAEIVPGGTLYTWSAPVIAPAGSITGGSAQGTGQASISQTLTNTTNAVATATYTVTPTSGTCAGATFTITVTVNPKATIANKVAMICSGTAFSVTPANGGAEIVPAGTLYTWTAPVIAPAGALTGGSLQATGQTDISQTLTNTTNAVATATYTVTPTSGTCAGATFTVTVTVNPAATIANKTATICSETAFSVTPTNGGAEIVPAGTNYTWLVPVISPVGSITGGSAQGTGQASISQTLTNTTNAVATATYTVTPTSGTCAGTTFTISVTVNPKATIANKAATICSESAFSITPVNGGAEIVPGGTLYTWTAPVTAPAGSITGGSLQAVGQSNISQTLTNTTTAPATATYTVTPVSGTCTGATFTLTVTVNPLGQANQPANQIVCNNANTTPVVFSTVNTVGATSYSWTNTAPGIGLASSGTGPIGAFTAANSGTTPIIATIVVTPTFSWNTVGCAGSTKIFTITVNPTPALSTTLAPAAVCSNNVFSYNPASLTTGTTFSWTRPAVPGITPAGPTSGTDNPDEILRNQTSTPIAVTYQYTLSANSCSNVQDVVVIINPEPVITTGQSTSACSGNALNYQILLNNFANPADNVTFTWPAPVLNPINANFTGGTARGSASAANLTDTFTNTMGGIGTATYLITPYKNGCAGTPVTLVVSVGSEPVLDPGLNSFACSNSAIGLILREAAGSVVPTYFNIISKTVAAGLTDAGNAVIPNATAPANYLSTDRFTNTTGVDKTVTYRVQPILAPNCIGAAVDVVITIRPQPVIFPAQTKTVCSGTAIGKEILLVPANTPTGTLFNWPAPVLSDASSQGTARSNVPADPAGTIHINDAIDNLSGAPITATYTITPVSSFGCAGIPTSAIFTINPEPVPQPISGRDKICVTDKNVVYNVTAVSGSTFHWTVDPAVGTKTFDFNANAILIDAALVAGSGNISVYETNSYTCNGDFSILPVQVFSFPTPENINGPAIVCANSTHVYNVTNRPGSTYIWTIPGGTAIIGDPSANTITLIFANVGGTISVRETNAAGCVTNHNPFSVSVYPLPTATISGGGTICDGASRNLIVDFTGTGPFSFTYALNGVAQPPINTAADPYTLNVALAGTYSIINVSDANCTNNGTGNTTVSYFPKPTGLISGTNEMCLGNSTTLTFSFTGTAPYTFSYSDGVTPITITGHLTNVYTINVSPVSSTTYTLTSLTDANSCTGVISGSAVITVNTPPVLTLTGTNLICYNVSTGAVDMTITGGTAPFGITWTGPDSFTASSEDISGLREGYYAVNVLDTKGCTATANVTLTQPPVLNGSAAGTNITCFGAADGTITISGATGGAGTYEFSINGGGLWQPSPNFSGLTPGTYNVVMRDAVNPACRLILNSALLITQPAVLSATVIKTDVNCFAANNGSIVISAPSGGYGTYDYSINGGANWQGSSNFANLAPGNYNVRIRDGVNTLCEIALASVTITQPPVISATVNSTNISCFGSTDGSITISAPAGGHGTYEYSINGGGSWQPVGNFTNLSPGTYNVQIHDGAFPGCYIVLNGALVITQPAVLTASVSSTNVTCNGANDGIISITAPSGGHGTYEYSISGGAPWQSTGSFNGVTPGTYDVRIRDAANAACEIILNSGLQITQPAALTALVIDTDVSCFGANDGVINITNSAGGYGTYQYSVNGGLTWQDSPTFTGLIPGTYDVRISDKAHMGCVVIIGPAVQISEPAVLNATVASTNVTCFGTGDGTITISSPTGGSGSYGYSINGGTSWQGSGNFSNLLPGTYNIRIRDAVHTGCIIALNPAVVISQPPVLSGTIVKTNVNCNGASDGSITVNGAAGGYGTYEYTVTGGTTWQGSNVFTGLMPGFYNVQIRDAANQACVITINGSVNVTEPALLGANVSRTNVTCNGASNGTITITSPSGGYGTYQYSIDGTAWQASGSFTGLAPANYNVQIRDAAHTACVIVLNPALAITEPAVLAATVTPTNVSCFGANNGVIAITSASGGYGTYEYSINGGTNWSGLGSFTNLPPATYDVRIRDAANDACVITLNGSLVITQPAVLSATVARTNITCFGAGDGTITISSPSGGYGTYEYTINGGGSWQVSPDFTALGPGNYNVQIRDAAHTACVRVLNNALQITQPAILNAVVTPTNVSCNGANNGIINITAPVGGYGTYEYSIDGGTGWQGTGLFTGLTPATYDVRIRDAVNTGCVIVLNNGLTITEPAVLDANVNSTNVTCFGANNGTISILNPTGGYGTYEYSNTGGTSWQATGIFTNLIPGSYNVQIRDKAHIACVMVLDAGLVITEPAVLSAAVAATSVTCFGANNGTITISNPLGGYGNYGYSINGGATWQSSGIFSNLAPATYNVRIRDAAYPTCTIILNAALIITQPAVLSATVASTNVTCNGANDGSITIASVAGGYGTYEYTIDGGASWQASGSFINLTPGFYNVQIRDAANTGCVRTLNGSLRITEPNTLSANVVSSNITCNGVNDGRITISSPTGGYGTYEYTIDGGGSWLPSGSFNSLTPATYNVQIRDAAHTGCVIVLNAALVITEPAVLSATVTPDNVTCNGAHDGIISISAQTGGYGSYQYSIDGGTIWSGSGIFTNLAPAIYNVQMRDAANHGCIIILDAALQITQPAVLSATVTKTDVSCFGGSDGTITISSPAGGYGTYEYSINGGGSWQAAGSFTALVPGNYNIRIRDAAHIGCVIILNNSLAITQPAVLNAVVSPTNVTCNSAHDGIINITTPSGGYGTYQYSIDGGSNWSNTGLFNGLAPASYDVRIRDAGHAACEVILNGFLNITEPVVLSANVSSTDVTCFGAGNGTITVTGPAGGYGTYEYSSDGGTNWQSTGAFTNLIPGSYDVRIRDRVHINCVVILDPALVITQPAILTATVASANVTCFSANNGTITITNPLGGYGTYGYSINGGTSWQSSGNFTGLLPGSYNVRIRDAANIACEIILNPAVVITQPPVLSATVASTNVTCYGASNGTITIANPLGGYGTYEYSVNGGSGWQSSGNFTALNPGFYNVQIRDAANTGCVLILNGSLRITEPSVLAAIVSVANVTCNGSNDGSITIIGATGGYGTYEYSINGGVDWQASGTFGTLFPGTYNVQIRDAAHAACVIILNPALVITQPAVLSATVTPTMVTCFNANNGIITIANPAGGSGSYQFSISGGASWQGSGTFNNLAPGSYNVRIRDGANWSCVTVLDPALSITQPPVLSAGITSTNVTCFGGNDGTITISGAAGGYGTYEYSINGGGSWQLSGIFTALTTGSYNIMIRDAAHIGCVIVLNSAYSVTQPGLLAATVSKADVTCNGANNGSITIGSPSGGYGTYEYSIDGGTTWQISGNFANLLPGTYDVRMHDAAHQACSVILYPNLVITEPVIVAMTSTGNIALNCFGDNSASGTFYASGGTMPYNFTVVTNTAGATISFPGFNSQTFFGAHAGTVTISVSDQNGCVAQGTIVISQPALLTPGAIGANQILCSGSNPAQLTETSPANGGPAAYVYQWQYGSTVAGPFINIAGANSSQYTPASGATTTLFYRRMVTSGMCAPVYSNVTEIRVNPVPLAMLTGGETICPGQTSVLKVNMMMGTGPFEIDIENYGTITGYVSGSDIVVSPAATTTYRLLRVRDANNCEVISSSPNLIGTPTVTVRLLPVITVQPVSRTSCEFGMITYGVTATGSDLTYQWYVNEGSGFNQVSDGGIYFGATASVLNLFGATRLMDGYIYHVVVSGCSASVTSNDVNLTVNTPPEIVTQPKDTTICMNAGATFNATATGTNITYQWQVNRGAGFVNIVNDANFSGANLNTLTITNAPGTFNNYIFRIIISGTCGIPVYSNFAVLRVNNPPVVTLNPVNKSVCDGIGPVLFSANGSGMIDSLRWQVFSGGVWTNIHDDAIYSGTTSQQLMLSIVPFAFNGNQYRLSMMAKCVTIYSNSAILTVYPNPVVDFSAVSPLHACGGVPLVLNGNPSGGSGIWASHLWTGDVGPLNNYYIQNPSFNSQIAGTYLLTYQVRDSRGCIASDDVSVAVDAPDASFSWDVNSGCTPATISFSKDMTGYGKFWWNFDDGSPIDSVNANPVHQFINVSASAIEYRNVKLTVRSAGGCLNTFSAMITVYPAIDATFTPDNDTICSGNSISFTALTGANKYFWDYGDGVSGYSTHNASHLYTNITTAPVVHTVTLTTTSFYNCTDIKTFDIVVMPVPLPQFSANPMTQVFNLAGNPVVFTNETNAGTWNWLWNFGDGATAVTENATHNYTDVGIYNVILNVSNASCSSNVTHQVMVTHLPPVADFDSLPSGCEPLSLIINNTSLNTDIPGTTYKWEFGDGSTSTAKNPTYTYFDAGTYRVELTVTGPGGTSVKSQVINVYGSPKAYFEISPVKVKENDEKVRCFNLSEGGSYYLWDFGDGDTSKVAEPYHRYMHEGVYDITLWAYSQNGCSDKYILSPGVTVIPSGDIRFSTVFTPNKDGEIDMDNLPTGSEVDKFFYPPIMTEVSKYKLQVFNRWGVLIFETDNVNKPWNGYYQHKLCPQGVYVWYVEGKYANGEPFKKVGDITLLH
jgi:gliding motility-associated-like protein